MTRLNTRFLATVSAFTGSNETPASPDKHGKMPVILTVVAGQCHNKRIIAGTLAERGGMEIGEAYLFQATETEAEAQYGRQFNFTAVKKASLMEIIQGGQLLGPAALLDVTSEVEQKAPIEIGAEA